MDDLVNVVVGRISIGLCCTDTDCSFRKFGRNFQRKFISPSLLEMAQQGRQSAPKLVLHLVLSCGVVLMVIVISMLRAY